ncbi:MAG: PEGA domain-containing protein [Planctomycetaceae bacterium]|nr:PEGA domain-containing protein [Planctomycetaceae bacterium]
MSASTLSRVLGVAVVAALAGCTLVVQGTHQPVTFTSEPPGATFTVAGQTGVTPQTLDLPKDDYQISFKLAGYEDASVDLKRKMSNWFFGSIAMGVLASTIDLATGAWKEFESTDIKIALQPLPDTVVELVVGVGSEPAGADIVIGGRSSGTTPRELRLSWQPAEREKEVTFRLVGHAPKTAALLRSEKTLSAALEALPVPVTVKFASTPGGAELRIDGKPQGKTPVPVDLLWRKDDKPRSAEFSLDGYKPEKRELTRDTKEVVVELQEVVEEIVLPLKIEPAGSKVVVDGVALPDGTKQVKLPWSLSKTRHTVTLSQPGYTTKTVEIRRPAAAAPLDVRLVPALPGNP